MPKMKDSGVKWLGLIPLDWEIKKAKYSFKERLEKGNNINLQLLSPTQKYGVIPQEMYQEITGLRCVQVGENANLNTFKTVHKNDFCISLSAYMGGFEYSEYEGVISPAYHSFYKTNDSIYEKYYKYLFKCFSFIDAINVITPNSVRVGRNTSFEAFGNLYIPIPPINIQKNIANFLEKKSLEIDSLYLDIEKQIETLEEYKKSVITEIVTKGLNPNVEMKDSGIEWIGMIPEHYEIKPLKYLVDYNASSLPENTTPDYEFDYIDISSVTYGKGIEQFQRMCFKDAPSRARRIVHKNDVILSTVRTYLKATAEIPENELPIIVSTGFITLTANALINPQYLKYIVQLDAFVSEVESRSTGVSYPAINASEVVKIKVILPPLNEQREVANCLNNKCTEIDRVIADKKAQLETLAEYKKSLIYEYVTGKKEVPENV